MAYLDDQAYDAGLNDIRTNSDELHICSQEPANYAEVATYTLGNKSSPTIGTPEDGDVSGRKIVVSAISDGSVTADGTATHQVLIDTVNSRVKASKALSSSQVVSNGNEFTLTSWDITFTDAT